MVGPRARRLWDATVMLLILASAFEVPYHILVGWSDPGVASTWSWTYNLIFGLDILIHIAFGDTAARFHDPVPPPARQPERALHYLRSRWFAIDFLAWLPLDLIIGQFAGLHVVRTARLLRSVHLMHAFKGLRAILALRRQISRHPAYARFLLLCFLVPWLIHLHTVVLVWAEQDHPEATIHSYGTAGHQVLVTLLTQDPMGVQTPLGYAVWVSTAILALLVVATVIGNAASLLMGIDTRMADLEKRLSSWHKLFGTYPQVFDAPAQQAIILHEQSRASVQRQNLTGQAQLIESLPGELEDRIVSRLQEVAAAGPGGRAQALVEILGGPDS